MPDRVVVLEEELRRRNYAELLAFAQWVKTEHEKNGGGDLPVKVDRSTHGLGLFATRDIAKDETVVYYGGFFSKVHKADAGEHNTHSIMGSDPTRHVDFQDAMSIDGKIVSAAFQDKIVSDEERSVLTTIAGAMANSMRETSSESALGKAEDAELLWTSPEGVHFAARKFEAIRAVSVGELLWDYRWSEKAVEPLAFKDMLRPAHQAVERRQRRKILPTPMGVGGGAGGGNRSGNRSGNGSGNGNESASRSGCGCGGPSTNLAQLPSLAGLRL